MNQTKISKVDILYQRNNQAILEMPKDYRKGHFMIRKNEIKIEKEEVQPPKKKDADQNTPKDYYQQRKKNILIIRDEREKQPYQSQKFLDDLPQAQSLILFKNKDKYSLNFVSQKSEVYKHMTEEFQNKIFKDIDKGLDARKNQENRDKVDIRVKKQIAGYEEDVLSGSDIEDPQSGKKKQTRKNKKEKVSHKLDYQSDEDKPKKKVKKDESSDDEVSSDYVQDSSDS
ncbi:unnamed protein product (macronuclear) [Paramecium tetraurelia]|uniref:Uncharacterized protein n=1 Tax=Paramecium tetraurelia TaxID=5888 RepID=A0CZM9_PARTE|nr:uncharacterized protein GSPATT00011819001 [Paramecium tetraurelia]CAK76246.1 unnamed protein product [Paramecium tetraurelia]|eukprot:XP_001443643.1 hypothetical protein (macronuclear) [Paramecium tetraurelia strain d4-2]